MIGKSFTLLKVENTVLIRESIILRLENYLYKGVQDASRYGFHFLYIRGLLFLIKLRGIYFVWFICLWQVGR